MIERPHNSSIRSLGSVLVLTPSQGLGGGIERYVDGICQELVGMGAQVGVVGLRHEWEFHRRDKFFAIWNIVRELRRARGTSAVLVMHAALASITAAVLRERAAVFLHGADIWGMSGRRKYALRRLDAELCTVSSFSAGALRALGMDAQIVPPVVTAGQSTDLLAQVDRASFRPVKGSQPLRVLTVFRLDCWREKGLEEVLCSTRVLSARGIDVHLTVAGRGPVPTELDRQSKEISWLSIKPSPSDAELAHLYGKADVFVLATRVSRASTAGEGFGIVAVEAQLAGTPVVVHRTGGQHDTIMPGITGVYWEGQTADTLANALIEATKLPGSSPQAISSLAISRFGPGSRQQQLANVLWGIREKRSGK